MKQVKPVIKIVNATPNMTESVYRGYRVCYSKYDYETMPIPAESRMLNFIKENMQRGHLTPLEHVSVTFSIEGISRAAQQQLTRHRTGKYNVQSQRYVDAANFGYVMPDIFAEAGLDKDFEAFMEFCEARYKFFKENIESFLDAQNGPQKEHANIAKENARAILPMATDSKMLVTFDLRNLQHFLKLRKCRHAQDEIRYIAIQMMKETKKLFPIIGVGIANCGSGCDCKEAAEKKKELKEQIKKEEPKAKMASREESKKVYTLDDFNEDMRSLYPTKVADKAKILDTRDGRRRYLDVKKYYAYRLSIGDSPEFAIGRINDSENWVQMCIGIPLELKGEHFTCKTGKYDFDISVNWTSIEGEEA